MSKIFMERLREIMAIRGRTNQAMADAVGMDRKMVVKMRTDPNYDPRLSIAEAMADDLDVPLSWLLGRDHEVKVNTIEVEKVVREVVEVPVEVVREVRRKFFNPNWEEGELEPKKEAEKPTARKFFNQEWEEK